MFNLETSMMIPDITQVEEEGCKSSGMVERHLWPVIKLTW